MGRSVCCTLGVGFALLLTAFPQFTVEAASTEWYAKRDAARRAAPQAISTSSVIIIDGTPPPEIVRPMPATRARDARSARRGDGGISLYPKEGPGPASSLQTILDDAGMAVPVGGDDVEIIKFTPGPVTGPTVNMDITSDGRIFVVVESGGILRTYISSDGGEVWTLWSFFGLPNFAANNRRAAFKIAEGTNNRAFYAYGAVDAGKDEIRVAYVDINAAPVWTVAIAITAPNADNGGHSVDIETDVDNYGFYYVYVVASLADENFDDDIWFSRSTNQGGSWEAGYKIADFGVYPEDRNVEPRIAYGENDYLHVLWRGFIAADGGVFYRRAVNVAASGIGDWQPRVVFESAADGRWAVPLAIEASTAGTNVIVAYVRGDAPDYEEPALVRFSSDHGGTWPPADTTRLAVEAGSNLPMTVLRNGEVTAYGQKAFGTITELQLARADTTDLTSWSAVQSFTKHSDGGFFEPQLHMAVDATRGNRAAMLWTQDTGPSWVVRFDAEWRRDPGYGNTEGGFPVTIVGGLTPPAIAELDNDPEGEIVFGTVSGDIYVLNHDGTNVPGWPQSVPGSLPLDGPIAVGDLTGNGRNSVVVGNDGGLVYAFDPEGNVMPGWPVTMDDSANVFVSIGALGPPNARYVVALCKTKLKVLRYDGASVWAGGGSNFSNPFGRPAAIGDVDDDGITEFVILHGSWFHVMRKDEPAPVYFKEFIGETFSDAPSLADIDSDGDLEIAAPTIAGKMHLLHHDGTAVTGWPVTVPSGEALTSAALANFLAGGEPEIVFGERDGSGLMHLFFFDGTEQSNYPKSFTPQTIYMPPIIAAGNPNGSANVFIGETSPFDQARSWSNLGFVPTGWPRNLPGGVEETPAAGDIDNDGRNEIVMVGNDFVTVLDVGVPPDSSPYRTWRMYGHDAQRTGCLACDEVLTSVEGGEESARIARLDLSVYPNPFNPSTTISYDVVDAGPIYLKIYDVAGRLVDTLIDGQYHQSRRYSLIYVSEMASGVYFLRLESGGDMVTRKISLLK